MKTYNQVLLEKKEKAEKLLELLLEAKNTMPKNPNWVSDISIEAIQSFIEQIDTELRKDEANIA